LLGVEVFFEEVVELFLLEEEQEDVLQEDFGQLEP
jgi:hypothetical protein